MGTFKGTFMGSGSTGVNTSNEKTCEQSTSRDLWTYVLTFSMCVTGVGRILG